jgi:AhpC/TSA family
VVAADAGRRVVIYDNKATEVAAPSKSFNTADPDTLWVTLEDLKRATQFELKPQGVCRDELCFPIPKARRSAFLSKQGSITWFNLSEFARLLRQPVAFDAEQSVWYFGPRADEQNSYVDSLIAPDFTLPDMNGKQHSLSNYRGKKVLLLTWASW